MLSVLHSGRASIMCLWFGLEVDVSDLIGSYRLMIERGFRVGVSAFTLQAGSMIAVKQQDNSNKKVLVEFGPRCCDWMPIAMLKDFERID